MLRRNEPQFIVHPLHTMNRYFNTNTFLEKIKFLTKTFFFYIFYNILIHLNNKFKN